MKGKAREYGTLSKSLACADCACDALDRAATFALRPAEEELLETAKKAVQELRQRLRHRYLDMMYALENEMKEEEE